MSTPFSQTLRSLERDRARPALTAILCTSAALAALLAWSLRSKIALRAVSQGARIVQERSVFPIEPAEQGRIVAHALELGREVAAGDLLVEFDRAAEKLALVRERAHADALRAELGAFDGRISDIEAAGDQTTAAAAASLEEARARRTESALAADLAEDELGRQEQLLALGGASEFEVVRVRAQAAIARASLAAYDLSLERLDLERRAAETRRAADLAAERQARGRLEGQLAVAEASAAELRAVIERGTLRAGVGGRIAEVAPPGELAPGAIARAGERLGAIVREGRLAVEARFDAGQALGRLRPGQRGQLELAGFPRAQFGAISVVVERIASESGDGSIRVELALDPGRGDGLALPALEHGMPGRVVVEVERVAPLALLLRAAGDRIAPAAEARTE